MTQPQHQREARLVALLAGDRRPDEAEVREWFAQDDSLREEFEALRALADSVAADAARQRDAIDSALRVGDESSHDAAVARSVPQGDVVGGLSAGARPVARLGRSRRIVLLAAAALVMIGLWLSGDEEVGQRRDGDRRSLGSSPVRIDEPVPQPDGSVLLSWSIDLPGAAFEASILDVGRNRTVLLQREEARELDRAWTLPAVEFAKLPVGSLLHVVARASGRIVAAERAVK